MKPAKPGLLRLLPLLTALLAGLLPTAGWSQTASEGQLKAAYLVNFLKYIEWPPHRQTAVICLLGRDNLAPYLAPYEGRLISGHELRIRRVASPDQLGDCQTLFVPDTEESRFSAVLRWTERQAILTVSDSETFARDGGGISLIRSEGRLQFDINHEALLRNNLKPTSQLMRLARQVIGGPR